MTVEQVAMARCGIKPEMLVAPNIEKLTKELGQKQAEPRYQEMLKTQEKLRARIQAATQDIQTKGISDAEFKYFKEPQSLLNYVKMDSVGRVSPVALRVVNKNGKVEKMMNDEFQSVDHNQILLQKLQNRKKQLQQIENNRNLSQEERKAGQVGVDRSQYFEKIRDRAEEAHKKFLEKLKEKEEFTKSLIASRDRKTQSQLVERKEQLEERAEIRKYRQDFVSAMAEQQELIKGLQKECSVQQGEELRGERMQKSMLMRSQMVGRMREKSELAAQKYVKNVEKQEKETEKLVQKLDQKQQQIPGIQRSFQDEYLESQLHRKQHQEARKDKQDKVVDFLADRNNALFQRVIQFQKEQQQVASDASNCDTQFRQQQERMLRMKDQDAKDAEINAQRENYLQAKKQAKQLEIQAEQASRLYLLQLRGDEVESKKQFMLQKRQEILAKKRSISQLEEQIRNASTSAQEISVLKKKIDELIDSLKELMGAKQDSVQLQ